MFLTVVVQKVMASLLFGAKSYDKPRVSTADIVIHLNGLIELEDWLEMTMSLGYVVSS
jgi:hypothetical protein